ncbi:MAG: four helix bundle protein [Bacteroidota bacterium]|nr:four helix bundle protein [Bacteroidota bacterium]
MHRFRELKVYNRALHLKTVREITRTFPKDEQFVLTAQFRRASDSITLNIAEGAGNESRKEFARLLTYSIRSAYECIGCIDIAMTIDYLDKEKHSELDKEVHEVMAMLVGLQQSLSK